MKLFKKSTLASPQLRRRKRRNFFIKIALAVAAAALLVYGLSVLCNLKAFTIHSIVPAGNSIITSDELSAIVDRELEGNFLYIFSKRNFLLYPKEQVLRAIIAAFPILSSVELDRKGMTKLEVRVRERKPAALWCQYEESSAVRFTEKCFLMDVAGYIYLSAPEFKGTPYIKYYGQISGDPLGQSFLPGKLAKLMQFIEGVRTVGLSPEFLYAKDAGDYELHLQGGGKVLFGDEGDLHDTLINLDTILQEDVLAGKKGAEIEYIDLRYGNRVFYKLRGGAESAGASTTGSH